MTLELCLISSFLECNRSEGVRQACLCCLLRESPQSLALPWSLSPFPYPAMSDRRNNQFLGDLHFGVLEMEKPIVRTHSTYLRD